MIFDLPDTTTHHIAKSLSEIRERGTQVTTGRVLTLIVVASSEDDVTSVVAATVEASREHPSRVLILVAGPTDTENKLDAEIRIGGDAGASEMVIMHLKGPVAQHMESVVTPLLLPDTPIVAWWPSVAPEVPAEHPIGRIAQRRITDSLRDPEPNPLERRVSGYRPGDSDMAWSRATQWRGVVASALDQPPHEEITSVTITGPSSSPGVDLAAGWCAALLDVPVTRVGTPGPAVPTDAKGERRMALQSIELHRPSGAVEVRVEDARTVSVVVPGASKSGKALVALGRRNKVDCLSEELRHMDPDLGYARALSGLDKVIHVTSNED